jgi:hypothetical protein
MPRFSHSLFLNKKELKQLLQSVTQNPSNSL